MAGKHCSRQAWGPGGKQREHILNHKEAEGTDWKQGQDRCSQSQSPNTRFFRQVVHT